MGEGSSLSVIPYGLYQVGEHEEIHSIDKMILLYSLSDKTDKEAFNDIADLLKNLIDFELQSDKSLDGYNCYIDKPPCTAYDWFTSALWLEGINIKFGMYYKKMIMNHTELDEDEEEVKRKGFVWDRIDKVKIEFNPNKSFSRTELTETIFYLFSHSSYVELSECDYSVDYPLKSVDFNG